MLLSVTALWLVLRRSQPVGIMFATRRVEYGVYWEYSRGCGEWSQSLAGVLTTHAIIALGDVSGGLSFNILFK